jgi:type VI protein secretion system component VasK
MKGCLHLSTTFMIVVVLIFVANLALIAWAVTDLLQRENVKYLSKPWWILIIAVVIFGSVIYLILGRGKDKGVNYV